MTWVGITPFREIGMTQSKMELLEELAEGNHYWMRAHAFMKSITNRKLSSLSDFQRRWLTTIILDLDSKLYKRAWRY